MKHSNIDIIELPEEEEAEQGIESLFKMIITENFPDLWKKKVLKIQETQRVPNVMNPKYTLQDTS